MELPMITTRQKLLNSRSRPVVKKLPERNAAGKFFVLIVTSARILRWPYRATEPAPMYNSFTEAEKILKAYLVFANNNHGITGKRYPEEFEVVELTEENKELIS